MIGDSGRLSEKRLSVRLKMRSKPASGAMAGAKGDMESPSFLLEAKSTVKDSIGVSLGWLAKVYREATMLGKKPALAVTFVDESGRVRSHGDWVLIRETDFREFMQWMESQE